MENHPIPQDVTGFQFKLVGNMTLKQFGYVGAGVIMCVVFFYAPLPFLIKFPLFLLSALTGIGLAFVPIEGRPMDLMLGNFMKAISRPNQFVYQKVGGSLSFAQLDLKPVVQLTSAQLQQQAIQAAKPKNESGKEERLREFLYEMPAGPQSGVDEKEAKYLSMFAPAAPVPAPKFAPQQPVRAVAPQPLIQQAPVQPVIQQPAPAFQYPVQQPAQPAQPILQPVQPQPAPVAIPVAAPQAQFIPQQPLAQMQPTQPAMPIPVQNMQPVMPVQAPITPPQPIMPQQQPVMAQPAPMPAPQAQIPQPIKPGPGVPVASEFPNLVSGIIKDSRGNVLSGILLEVKNKNGESVRAFKTNALGQFASATQITNGSYTIEFEDPKKQHTFAKIAVEANGSIILPLEIISTDGREELRKELFG